MTLTARDIAYSVAGAYRLAWFDASGLGYLDSSPEGALRSFYAAVIVAPAYAILMAIRLWDAQTQASFPHLAVVESIAYVVSWCAFPLAMHGITGMLDRQRHYPGYVCAYNWSAVVQMSIYLPVIVLSESGVLPDALAQALVFGVMMAMLTYQWFVARTALDIGGFTAAAVVLLDLFISAMVTDFADSLL